MVDEHARLSQIETLWTSIVRTRDAPASEVEQARRRLLERYGPAVERYIFACLNDQEASREVYQEFALRVVRGDFAKASADRGRFRDYVKRSIFTLVMNFHRRRARDQYTALPPDQQGDDAPSLDEETLTVSWRDHLLDCSWLRLQAQQQKLGQPYYDVLRLRVDEPDLSSADIAVRLSDPGEQPRTVETVRVLLTRARQHFAHSLIDVVRDSIESPAWSDVEEELIHLGLLEYCRGTLERRRSNQISQPADLQ